MSFNLRTATTYALIDGVPVINLRSAPVYALVSDVPSVDLRTASAYVLEDDQIVVNVRTVNAYVMEAQTPTSIFSDLTGLETLRAAIKRECGVTVTDTLATFGDPAVATGYYNSSVTLTAPLVSYYRGTVKINYNRLDLNEAFKGKDVSTVIGSANTVHGRLAVINANYGLKLEPRDVVDAPIVAGSSRFKLRVAATSYLFLPGTELWIGSVPTLASVAPITDLSGFDPA